jgi:hypothetical protein
MAQESTTPIYQLDGSWSSYSENCWDCSNLTDCIDHVCAAYGTCPFEYWEDKKTCPKRVLAKAEEPVKA